jgi:hypothetical protein
VVPFFEGLSAFSYIQNFSLHEAFRCDDFVAFTTFLGALPYGAGGLLWQNDDYEDARSLTTGCGWGDGILRCHFKCPAQIMKIFAFLKWALITCCGLLVSCTLSEYPFGKSIPYGGVSSIPSGYTGNAYFWNGSYYTGGRYETGRFYYNGQLCDSRYMFNGRYLYGGNLQSIQGGAADVERRYYSNQRYYNKHRYYQPFHRHLYR